MPPAPISDKQADDDSEQPVTPGRFSHLSAAVWVALALVLLTPMLLCVLLRTGALVPAEQSIALGPLRVATTCFSRKRFCLPLENSNPPPSELFVLIDWPGGERREDVLLTLPLR